MKVQIQKRARSLGIRHRWRWLLNCVKLCASGVHVAKVRYSHGYPGRVAWVVMVLYAVLFNAIPIIVQRYNRQRLLRIL